MISEERIQSKPPLKFSYIRYGSGSELLLAFHGFGNHAKDWKVFEGNFGQRYTLIAVHLFYHDQEPTGRPAEAALEVAELELLIDQLLNDLNADRFSVLGFSLGGRIILSFLPAFHSRIDRILLLAPDGLFISPWYTFITRTALGKFIFRRVMKNPKHFFTLAGIVRSLGLVGEKQYKFALGNFDTAEKRELVYKVWMFYRNLLPDYKKLADLYKERDPDLTLVFGKKDTIIPESFGLHFVRKTGIKASIRILEAGHFLLREKIAKELNYWTEDKKKDADG